MEIVLNISMNANDIIFGKIYYNLNIILQQKRKINLIYVIGNVNILHIKLQNIANFPYGMKKQALFLMGFTENGYMRYMFLNVSII